MGFPHGNQPPFIILSRWNVREPNAPKSEVQDGDTDEEKELAEAKGNELQAPHVQRWIIGMVHPIAFGRTPIVGG